MRIRVLLFCSVSFLFSANPAYANSCRARLGQNPTRSQIEQAYYDIVANGTDPVDYSVEDLRAYAQSVGMPIHISKPRYNMDGEASVDVFVSEPEKPAGRIMEDWVD